MPPSRVRKPGIANPDRKKGQRGWNIRIYATPYGRREQLGAPEKGIVGVVQMAYC